ncbi:MAG TPA: iron ABC transporter substrate-binding protein [Catenuloplanes sp.]
MPTVLSPALRKAATALTACTLALGLAACGGGDQATDSGAAGDKKITLYSGRNEALVKPLLAKFTAATGIAVNTRYASTAQLAAQLLEEGAKSPADAFFAQDAGALGAVSKKGLFATLPGPTLDKVPANYRANGGEWVGVTARARVLVYNPDLVPAAQLPSSVFDLTGPAWKGRIGVAPTNASFQAFVTAMRVKDGEAKTKAFLTGLKANEPVIRDGNIVIVEEVNDGKIPAGLVNHYYLGEVAKEKGVTPDQLKAKLHFFPNGDTGALVNVAGVGLLKKSAQDPDLAAFVDYLLGTEAQTYFAQQIFEYPVISGVPAPAGVPPLADLKIPAVNLNDLDGLDATIALIKESGLTP